MVNAVCIAFLATAMGAWGQPPPVPSMPSVPGRTGGGDKLILLNFRDAPLDQVLQFYAELTGRTMIKSPGINATITLRGQTRLTQTEALEALDAVLAMNNVALVPLGEKFFKVVQPTAIRQEGMPFVRTQPEAPFEETDELISQIVALKHLEISEVQPIVQSFIHGYGKIQPLERANSLLITDTASNLQRIMEMLEIIDQPVAIKVEMRIYNIHHVEASEIASKLNELIAESRDEDKPTQPRVAQPTQTPRVPGIIRARQAQQAEAQSGAQSAGELAERGIIQGDVKIIADDRTGILFVFSVPENFVFFDRIIEVLDVSVEAEIVVRVEPLEYADAEEIAGILNEFIGAASSEDTPSATPAEGEEASPRAQALRDFVQRRAAQREREAAPVDASRLGSLDPDTRILADKRTNSLLLMGRRSDIIAVQNMIDQLDIMLAQVLIEAVIMEIDLRDDMSHGIDWLQRAFTVYSEELRGPGGGIAVRDPVYAFGGGQRVLGSAADFIDASTVGRDTGIGSSLTYYTTLFDLNIDAIIQLVAGSSDARILSTPVVVTTDNTTAKILVGEERPIVNQTSTTTGGEIRSSYEYRNIGIDLTVTPRINPERFVVMEINQKADDVGGTVLIDGNEVPIITKREFEAFIGVESRETVVLGGLMRTDRRKTRSKVPLLGDIPILGALFRADAKDNARTELMVMITPYVMVTPTEAIQETRRLYESSALPDSRWERGWSDSKLAEAPDLEQLQRERKKRGWQRHERETTEDLLLELDRQATEAEPSEQESSGTTWQLKASRPVPGEPVRPPETDLPSEPEMGPALPPPETQEEQPAPAEISGPDTPDEVDEAISL